MAPAHRRRTFRRTASIWLVTLDEAGIYLQLIDTGETRTISQPQGFGQRGHRGLETRSRRSPDAERVAGAGDLPGRGAFERVVHSCAGRGPREIHGGGLAWAVSPDGSLIAFTSTSFASDIWLMGANAEEPRKVVTADEGEIFMSVVWSPVAGELPMNTSVSDPQESDAPSRAAT